MQILTVRLNIDVYWGITLSDPKAIQLACLPGWSLVNPLLYEPIQRQSTKPGEELASRPDFIIDERVHVVTNGMMLVSPSIVLGPEWFGARYEITIPIEDRPRISPHDSLTLAAIIAVVVLAFVLGQDRLTRCI